jgi:protein N-terminal glutamine amidohydrolase
MRYCAYFCEENVWHLCRDDSVASEGRPVPIADRRVVFISNEVRSVPMLRQRAGVGGLVQWDYHVVLLARASQGWSVWDLDSTLGMPVAFAVWLSESFLDETAALPAELAPRFRVVEAARFLEVFASDRSHMNDERGRARSPHPPWPPIGAGTGVMNLPRFIDVTAPFEGEVLDAEALRRRFAPGSRA